MQPGSRTVQQDADGTFDPELLTRLTESAGRRLPGEFTRLAARFPPDRRRLDQLRYELARRRPLPSTRHARLLLRRFTQRPICRRSAARARSGRHSGRHLRTRTGTPIHTAYAPPQLLRLAAEEPDLFAQVACWQTIASHLLGRWQGLARAPISSSEVGWMGLLDPRRPTRGMRHW